MPGVGTLWVKLSARTKDYEKKMSRAMRGLDKWGGKAQKAGRSMTMGVTAPMLGAAAAGLKLSTDLNAGMANVATLIPQSGERIRALKKDVQDLSIATGQSTKDLAAGLYQTVSAFGDSAESAERLKIVTMGAVAGVATTTDSLNLLSAVTKGYGDTTAAAMGQAADLAFQTVKLGQTTFPELAASMGRVVPIAAAMKVSQKELFAGFATLTGVTGNAAEVSTQLSSVLRSMAKEPTPAMTAALEKLGFATAEQLVQTEGLKGSLDLLVGTTDRSATAISALFGRAEAGTAALALTGEQSADFTRKMGAMANASGSAEEAFREQTEGINKVGFAFKVAKAKAVVLGQQLGDELGPVVLDLFEKLEPLAGAVKGLLEKFAEAEPATKAMVLGIGGLVMAVGPALMAMGSMAKGLATAKIAIAAIGAVGIGPIGILIAAIGAVVLAWRNWGYIGPFLKGIYDVAKKWLVDNLGGIFEHVRGLVESFWGGIKWVYNKVAGLLGKAISGLGLEDELEKLAGYPAKIGDAVVTAVEWVGGEFKDIAAGIKQVIAPTVWLALDDIGKKAKDTGEDFLWQGPIQASRREVESLGNAAKGVLDEMGDSVADWGSDFGDTMVSAATEGLGAFKDFATGVLAEMARIAIQSAIIKPLMSSLRFGVEVGHGGGIIGSGALGSRMVPAGAFAGAGSYGMGGVVGNEVPVIAHRGEGIFTPEQMRAMGGGGAPQITIIDQTPQQNRYRSRTTRDAAGRWQTIIWMREAITEGHLTQAAGQAWGVQQRSIGR